MTSKSEIKLNDLYVLDLSTHDKEVIAMAINQMGSGDHPMASVDNLHYFNLDYTLDCLDKGSQECSSEQFKDEVQELWCAIHMAREEWTEQE